VEVTFPQLQLRKGQRKNGQAERTSLTPPRPAGRRRIVAVKISELVATARSRPSDEKEKSERGRDRQRERDRDRERQRQRERERQEKGNQMREGKKAPTNNISKKGLMDGKVMQS
jgi:hypothetical protein